MWNRPSLAWALVVLSLGVATPRVHAATSTACPFCSASGQTLSKDVSQSAFVVFGTLSNAKPATNEDGTDGRTDISLDVVVKDHAFLRGKKSIVLPRYFPIENQTDVKFVVFCDFYKDKVDPYRGIPCKDKALATYLMGAVAAQEKPAGARLNFFFDYLDHGELEIATDAYKEFANADNKDAAEMIAKGDKAKIRAKLVAWLRDHDTPGFRYGLYGYLLGMAGGPQDADVLLELLNDPKRGLVSGIDGVLAGYVSLKPKEGWEHVYGLLKDPSREFMQRYAGLRSVRFLWDFQANLLPRQTLLNGFEALLDQGDIADLAIDDLRTRQQWQMTERILALASKTTHQAPIVQRSIIRFALSAPGEKALAFVKEQRKTDPERVKDVEELLKFEKPLSPEAATKTTTAAPKVNK